MVTVAVDARVGSVGHAAIVCTVCASRVVVAGHTSTARVGVGVVAGMGVDLGVAGVTGAAARCPAVVAVAVNTRISGVGHAATVGAVNALRVIVARGRVAVGTGACSAESGAGSSAVVTVRVDTRISSVGYAPAVRAVSTLRGAMGASLLGLVVVESLLDLVDESGHFGW